MSTDFCALRDKLIRCGWVTNFNADTLVQLIERHYAALAQPEPDVLQLSDGYHTFAELYEHRHALCLALMRAMPQHCWFSLRHADGERCFGGTDWFIFGAELPGAGSVTYHLPVGLYPIAQATGAAELEKGRPWDGHTAADVVSRLRDWASLAQPEPQGPDHAEICRWLSGQAYWGPHAPEIPRVANLVQYALTRWGRPAIEPVPADELLAAYRAGAADAAIEPVPVSERLPEPGVKVLAHYLNSHGKSRTVCARWIPAKFESSDPETDDLLECDEDSDAFYWPEGWYETIENWDDYGSIMVNEGEVTHWLPLPHWALPLPGEVDE
jgi:hypothetical protein